MTVADIGVSAQIIELDRQLNELVLDRREVNDKLAVATSFAERRQLTDKARDLETQRLELEAEKRQFLATHGATIDMPDDRGPAPRPTRTPPKREMIRSDPVSTNGAMMPKPTFELYRSMRSNSVAAMPGPAVSLTTTQMSFNQQALDELAVKVGEYVLVYFAREHGVIALTKPKKGWEASNAIKISKVAGAAAGCFALGAFVKWSGLDAKKAKGIYPLEHDEDHGHWTLQLPPGSWTKPPVGATSAQKRRDLPTTSPHRQAG